MSKDFNNNNNKQQQKKKKKDTKTPDSTSAPKIPVKTIKKYTNLRAALAAYRFPVDKDGTLQHFLKDIGIPTFAPETWHDPNRDGHPVAHASRLYSIVQVARDLASRTNKNEIHLLDYYGRDWNALKLPPSEEGVAVFIHSIRPRVYAGDKSRAISTDSPTPAVFDAVLFVDIYLHIDKTTPLGPAEIASVMREYSINLAYVVTQDLREHYGSHVHKTSIKDGDQRTLISSQEGSWESIYLDGLRHIVFKPDRHTNPYPPHAYVHMGGSGLPVPGGFLHTGQMTQIGTYSIYLCAFDENPVHEGQKDATFIPRYNLAHPGDMALHRHVAGRLLLAARSACLSMVPKTWAACAQGFPTSRFAQTPLVKGLIAVNGVYATDQFAYAELAVQFMGKQMNNRTVSSMLAVVQGVVDQNQLLAARYPTQRAALVLNTVMHFLADRPDAEFIESQEGQETAESLAVRADFGAGKAKAGPAAWSRVALLAAGAMAAAGIYWYFRKNTAGATACSISCEPESQRYTADFLFSAAHVLGTAGEELAKCVFGYPASLFLSVVEALPLISNNVPVSQIVAIRLPATLFHFATAAMYYQYGYSALAVTIPTHWCFNGAVVAATLSNHAAQKFFWPLGLPCLRSVGQQCLQGQSIAPLAWSSFPGRNAAWIAAWILSWARRLRNLVLAGRAEIDDTGAMAANFADVRAARWSDITTENFKAVIPIPGVRISPTPCEDWIYHYLRCRDHPVAGDALDWRHQLISVSINGHTEYLHLLDEARLREVLSLLDHSNDDCTCMGLNSPEDSCASCAHQPESNFMYPLMITQGLLHKPSNSARNTLSCLLLRWYFTDQDIETSIESELEFERRCSAALDPAVKLLHEHVSARRTDHSFPTIQECAAQMPKQKGRRLLNGWDQDQKFGAFFQEVKAEAAVKHNETVKTTQGLDGAQLKPRAIINVSPEVQSVILPRSRAYAEELKEIFDGSEVLNIGNYMVRLIITKQSKADLDSYACLASTSREMCVFVSCDDMIIFTGGYEVEFGCAILESDYSSYDQTQRRALWRGLWQILQDGTEEFAAWTRFHDELNMAPIQFKVRATKARPDTIRIQAPLRYAMRTGVGTTSIFGSVNNLMAVVTWLLSRSVSPQLTFEASCKAIGLKAKVSYHSDWNTATFLKGWFTADSWNVLVSSCLKLGKSMRFTTEPAAFFFGIMSSVKVPYDYPILGAMKLKSVQLNRPNADGLHSVDALRAMRQSHDPTFNENAIHKILESRADRQAVLDHMLARYGITESMILDAESQIHVVCSLPVMLVHPVYEIMRRVDY